MSNAKALDSLLNQEELLDPIDRMLVRLIEHIVFGKIGYDREPVFHRSGSCRSRCRKESWEGTQPPVSGVLLGKDIYVTGD